MSQTPQWWLLLVRSEGSSLVSFLACEIIALKARVCVAVIEAKPVCVQAS